MNRLPIVFFFIGFMMFLEVSCSFTASEDDTFNNMAVNQIRADQLPYYTFAKQLEETINARNPDFLNENFQVGLLLSRLARELGLSSKVAGDLLLEFQNETDLGRLFINSLEGEGQFRFVSMRGLPQKPSLLFRLTVNEELNYFEIFLTPAQSADLIRVHDFCNYKGGLTFYETLKAILLGTLKNERLKEVDANLLSQADLAKIEHAAFLDDLTIAVQNQAFGQASRMIKQLPEALKFDKMILMLKLKTGYYLKNELLTEAQTEFRKAFPANPIADFLMLQLSVTEINHALTLQFADRLATQIQDKYYLNLIKAAALQHSGDFEKSELLLRDALELEPEPIEAYERLSGLLLEEERFDVLLVLFDRLINHLNQTPELLLTDVKCQEFFKTELYQKWWKSYCPEQFPDRT